MSCKLNNVFDSINKNLNFFIIALLFLILSLLISPFVAFPDSYMYLNSANVLFTKQFFSEYQWFKEPLYPLTLKILSLLFGKNDYAYTAFHSTLIIISVYLILKSFDLINNLKFTNTFFLVIFTFNPFLIAWTSMILQTSMFIFFLSIFTYLLFEVVTKNRINNLKWFFINLFGFVFAIQIGVIGLICYISANIYLYLKRHYKSQNIIHFIVQSILFINLIFSWNEYKENNLERNKMILPDYNSAYYTKAQQILMPLNRELPSKIFDHTFSLLNLNSRTMNSAEVKQFVLTSFSGNYNCGLWYPSENAYLIEKISTQTITNCKNPNLIAIYNKLIPFGEFLWRISMSILLINIIYFLFTKNFNKIILNFPSYLFLLSYSILIFVTDRYIFALYIYGFINTIYILNRIWMNKFFQFKVKNDPFKHKL